MSSTRMDVAIIREAQKRGWNPSRLTDSQYRSAALATRSLPRKIADGVSAEVSHQLTSHGFRIVLPQIAAGNKSICETNPCGSYGILADGAPVCHQCHCSGKYLTSKWKDATQTCPYLDPKSGKPAPFWDNTKVDSAQTKIEGSR